MQVLVLLREVHELFLLPLLLFEQLFLLLALELDLVLVLTECLRLLLLLVLQHHAAHDQLLLHVLDQLLQGIFLLSLDPQQIFFVLEFIRDTLFVLVERLFLFG